MEEREKRGFSFFDLFLLSVFHLGLFLCVFSLDAQAATVTGDLYDHDVGDVTTDSALIVGFQIEDEAFDESALTQEAKDMIDVEKYKAFQHRQEKQTDFKFAVAVIVFVTLMYFLIKYTGLDDVWKGW